jgi:hypothetical protein
MSLWTPINLQQQIIDTNQHMLITNKRRCDACNVQVIYIAYKLAYLDELGNEMFDRLLDFRISGGHTVSMCVGHISEQHCRNRIHFCNRGFKSVHMTQHVTTVRIQFLRQR